MIRIEGSGAVPSSRPPRFSPISPGTVTFQIPKAPAWGSVFVPGKFTERFTEVGLDGKRVALPSYDRFMNLLDLAKDQGIKSVTVYAEVQPKGAVDFSLTNFGILTVNLAELDANKIDEIVQKAKNNGIHIDLHAPWLSGNEGRGSANEVKGKFSYPDPMNNPEIFKNISEFSNIYVKYFGQKLELTIHTSGNPEDWAPWINQNARNCMVHVENGFIYSEKDRPEGAAYPADSFAYFNASRPYKMDEYMDWLTKLKRAAGSAAEINALIDIAHAAAAENDPLAYLYFIDRALKVADVRRVHVASVNLDGKTLSERDNHGVVPEFGREAAIKLAKSLGRCDELAFIINRVFDHIEKLQQDNAFGITNESKSYLG